MAVQDGSFFERAGAGFADTLLAWCEELASIFAGRDRASKDRTIVLEFGPQETLVFDSARDGRIIGIISREASNPERELKSVIQRSSLHSAVSNDAVIRLQPNQVLRRTLHLPNASARVLKKAVQFELERISPLESTLIIFDMRVLSRNRVTKRATIGVRLIRRDLVEQIRAQCRSFGVKIAALNFPADISNWPWRGFPVDRAAAARIFLRRRGTALLGGLAVVLAMCSVGTEYVRNDAAERAIVAQVDSERQRAGALRVLRATIETTRQQIAFLGAERKAPLFVVILTDLSGLVPKDAWATEVELSREKVRLRGFALSASRLISIFEKSQRFGNARFESSLTRGPNTDSERFDLSAEIETKL